jgi:Ni,Fe-hydrogenase III large subunit/Ni,Fe-hydrogenase III component G
MMMLELIEKLSGAFPNAILRETIRNNNECYLEVRTASAAAVCTFMSIELELPLIDMFATDERGLSGSFVLYYVFAERETGYLFIVQAAIDPEAPAYESITPRVHAAALYEREIKDLFGLIPTGHPDAKRLVLHGNWPNGTFPLRKDFDPTTKPDFVHHETKFARIQGQGVFEIPVGPVHAGIIEPGHFRFSLAGEPILNLEAQLYFVHKGIEKMCEGQTIERCFYISERISGDETFANSLAYCQAIEKIAGIKIPSRADYTRVIFAELERLTSHLGDLAGICLDAAYGFAAFQFRMMRGWSYLLADDLCGMRFLRSVNKPGGLRKDFIQGKESGSIEQLLRIKKELEDTEEILLRNSMFIDRVENTGILMTSIAADLNAVGPPARAAGILKDVRKAFPYAAYAALDFRVHGHLDGDVNGRMIVKIQECFESISLMVQAIEGMPEGKMQEPIGKLEAFKVAFGMNEAPRGENIHWIMTGENNTIFRYKVRTPSFCNWPALCHAVKGNVVPDFPLINKSFNLSYAGNDL